MPHMPHTRTALHRSDEARSIERVRTFRHGAQLEQPRPHVRSIGDYIDAVRLLELRANHKHYLGHSKRRPPAPDTSAPHLAVNTALIAPIGATTKITAQQLAAADPDNTASQLRFTVTTAPAHGTLSAASFTQADINAGNVSYSVPGGVTAGADLFGFTLSDPAGNKIAGNFVVTLVEALNVPPAKDWLTVAFQTFGSTDVGSIFPMDGNDRYGDCVAAAAAHGVTMWRAMLGQRQVIAEQTVIDAYFALTGGGDTGLNPDTTVRWMMANSDFGDKLLGYVDVLPGNLNHVRDAIDLFGGCWLAFTVPQNVFDYFANRWPWIPDTATSSGHAVYLTGYDDAGTFIDPNSGKSYRGLFNCLTWGGTQLATYDFVAALGRVIIPIVPAEAESLAWDGLALAQIMADLTAAAG